METKKYSAMLYALADEIRKEEGCVTVSARTVEEAAYRMDIQTVEINVITKQRDELLTVLELSRSALDTCQETRFANVQMFNIQLVNDALFKASSTIASVKGGLLQPVDQNSQAENGPDQIKSCGDSVHADGDFVVQGEVSLSGLDDQTISAATSDERSGIPAIVFYPAGSLGEEVRP